MNVLGPYISEARRMNTDLTGEEAFEALIDSQFEKVYGINIPNKVKVLGEGTRGIVFDIGSGKAMKITDDDTDADASSLLVGKNMPGLLKVYGVYMYKGDLILYEAPYIIIAEKLKKPSAKVSAAIDKLYDSSYPTSSDYHDLNELREAIDKAEKEENDPIMVQILWGLHSLIKLGIRWSDLHVGNTGVNKKGEAVILDLGYSDSGKKKIVAFESYESSK